MINRRELLVGSTLSAVSMPAVASRLSTNGGIDGFESTLPQPPALVEPNKVSAPTVNDRLRVLAREAARMVLLHAQGRGVEFLPIYGWCVMGGDTVVIGEQDTKVKFDIHLVSDTQSVGLDLLALDDAQVLTAFAPSIHLLANLFANVSHGKTVKMSRLHIPLVGCGAIGEIFTLQGVAVRAVASYDPVRLCMLFSFDMLYGHAEKI